MTPATRELWVGPAPKFLELQICWISDSDAQIDQNVVGDTDDKDHEAKVGDKDGLVEKVQTRLLDLVFWRIDFLTVFIQRKEP